MRVQPRNRRRENCTSGTARGVPGNRHSYRGAGSLPEPPKGGTTNGAALGVFVVVRVLRRRLADFFGHPWILAFAPCFGNSKHFNDMLPLIPHIEGVAKALSYLQVQRIERCGCRVSRGLLVVGLPPPAVEVYL